MNSLLLPLKADLHYADLVREALADLEDERLRRERFRDEVREDQKAEFINGEVVMHSPAKVWHSDASGAIFQILAAYSIEKNLGRVFHEKTMVALTRNDYEPDVLFYGNEKSKSITPQQMLLPAPDLIVEVLSPSTAKRDRTVKLLDYAEHGVGEYWLVDPEHQTVEQYLLAGGVYLEAFKGADGIIECRELSGLRVPVVAIFSREALSKLLREIMLGDR